MAKPQGMDATTVASGAAATSGAAVSKARAGMAPAVDATAHVDAVDAAAARPEAAQEGAGGSWKQLKLHANTLRGGSGLEVALRWEASLAALRAYVDGGRYPGPRSACAEERSLAHWCQTQRQAWRLTTGDALVSCRLVPISDEHARQLGKVRGWKWERGETAETAVVGQKKKRPWWVKKKAMDDEGAANGNVNLRSYPFLKLQIYRRS